MAFMVYNGKRQLEWATERKDKLALKVDLEVIISV
jgi:hypothetical protein